MISQSSRAGWRCFDREMRPAKIVVHEKDAQHVAMVFQFFREAVRQPRETSIAHAQSQIAAFCETCAYQIHIWISENSLALGPDHYIFPFSSFP